jgi:hypothetical protein
VTSVVVEEKYSRELRDNLGWRVEKIQEVFLADLGADVSIPKCRRVKIVVTKRMIDTN